MPALWPFKLTDVSPSLGKHFLKVTLNGLLSSPLLLSHSLFAQDRFVQAHVQAFIGVTAYFFYNGLCFSTTSPLSGFYSLSFVALTCSL